MRSMIIALLYGLGSCAMSHPILAADSQWPIFRGNAALTGVSNAKLTLPLKLAWEFQAGDTIRGSAVVGDNRVVVADSAGSIHAINLANGKPLWTFQTGDVVEASPLLIDQLAIVGALNGKLYALNVADGSQSWIYDVGDRIIGSANATGASSDSPAQILFGSYDNKLHALDLKGKPRWTFETESFINGAPATDGKLTLFGGCDANLHSLAISNGSERAAINLGSYIAGSPAIKGDYAYVGHYGGQLICVDLAQNKIKWSYGDKDNGDAFFSSPAVTKHRVLIGCRDRKLHCVNADDGSVVWTFQTGGDVDSSPVVSGNKVIFGSRDGRLYVANLSDGKELWRYDAGSPITASPAIIKGSVIITTESGLVLAWRMQP